MAMMYVTGLVTHPKRNCLYSNSIKDSGGGVHRYQDFDEYPTSDYLA